MKRSILTVMIVALTTLASLTAGASEKEMPKGTLVQVWTAGGLVPLPDYHSGLRVMENGNVLLIEGKKVSPVAKLSARTLSALKRMINGFEPGVLVDYEPDAPMCLDAPSTSYDVVRADGQVVKIGAWASCHDYVLQQDNVHIVLEAVKGLKTVSWLQ
jgi:hypothetical protein